uniref:phage portal protein family protein n=1 Tax=Pseudomonas aeruginosa TaxID=287 RepID=UPI0035A6DFD4
MPLAFHHRPQSWFQLNPEDQNELRLRDNSPAGEALQPFGWIIHRPRALRLCGPQRPVSRAGLAVPVSPLRHLRPGGNAGNLWPTDPAGEISARYCRRGKGNLAAGRYRPGPCCRRDHPRNHGHRLPAGRAG